MTHDVQQPQVRPELAIFIGGYRQYRAYVSLHRDEWAQKPLCIAGPESLRGYNPNGAVVVMTRDWRMHYTRSAAWEMEHGLERWGELGGKVEYWDD